MPRRYRSSSISVSSAAFLRAAAHDHAGVLTLLMDEGGVGADTRLEDLDAVVKRIESGMTKVEKHSGEDAQRAAAQDEEGGGAESVKEE